MKTEQMSPEEFIDENYFSLTLDCKREIGEIYAALEDYAKTQQLITTDVDICPFEAYAVFCIECDRQGLKPINHKDYLKLH